MILEIMWPASSIVERSVVFGSSILLYLIMRLILSVINYVLQLVIHHLSWGISVIGWLIHVLRVIKILIESHILILLHLLKLCVLVPLKLNHVIALHMRIAQAILRVGIQT